MHTASGDRTTLFEYGVPPAANLVWAVGTAGDAIVTHRNLLTTEQVPRLLNNWFHSWLWSSLCLLIHFIFLRWCETARLRPSRITPRSRIRCETLIRGLGRTLFSQLQAAVFLPPAVVGLLGDSRFLAGLRGRLSIRDLDFDLPQQIHNLHRLYLFIGMTGLLQVNSLSLRLGEKSPVRSPTSCWPTGRKINRS
jgi:hypothetical protein